MNDLFFFIAAMEPLVKDLLDGKEVEPIINRALVMVVDQSLTKLRLDALDQLYARGDPKLGWRDPVLEKLKDVVVGKCPRCERPRKYIEHLAMYFPEDDEPLMTRHEFFSCCTSSNYVLQAHPLHEEKND